ncbi:MAG: hypothetical protein V3W50_06320 [Thermoanaerobaculia bacterium]
MAGARKVLTYIAAFFGVVILSWVLLIGAVYAWGGVMTVSIEDRDEGFRLYLPMPVAVVDAAVATADWVLDEEELLELQADLDLGEWTPMIRGLLEALDDCPDFTLVEVEDGDVWVRVRKKRGKLVVEVEEPSVSVKVSVPTRTIRRTVSRLTS